MRLKDVLKGVACRAGRADLGTEVTGVSDDSRAVKEGDIFVAVRGCALDGHEFIGEALSKGAGAVVSEDDFSEPSGRVAKILTADTRKALPVIADNFYSHPSKAMKVIGITGTNGKTTISYIIEAIVRSSGHEPGVIGTINYRYRGSYIPSKNTTPGVLDLQSMLARMLRDGVDHAIMEVSSHSLDQGRIERVSLDAGIFTNITSDHLDYHKTRQRYFRAKIRLFDHLKTGGFAILNTDNSKVASLKRSLKKKVITYGIKTRADITARDISLSMDGTGFSVRSEGSQFAVKTKLIGIHNVSNILASIAAAKALRIPDKCIIKGIGSIENVPGRLEAVDAGQAFKVFVDFAHTEDALYNILSLLKQVAKRRIVTVFGCGGDRDRTKRPKMGRVACRLSDHVVITSDNPRTEEPSSIAKDIEFGIRKDFSNYDIILDRKQAIEKALSLAGRNDIVVLAGKGHESSQIMKDRAMPFDDRDVALEILKSMRGKF